MVVGTKEESIWWKWKWKWNVQLRLLDPGVDQCVPFAIRPVASDFSSTTSPQTVHQIAIDPKWHGPSISGAWHRLCGTLCRRDRDGASSSLSIKSLFPFCAVPPSATSTIKRTRTTVAIASFLYWLPRESRPRRQD